MANVTFTPNHQPAPACYPADANKLLDMLTTGGGLSGTIPDSAGGGIYVGSSPPSSSLTQKVWFKTDAAGRPLGVFMFYNGNWRRVYTGQLSEIKIFGGNTAGYFDGTGRGVIGGDYDGWALCNGNNGTYNLSDKFIVPGTWNGSQWVSAVSGSNAAAGGSNTITPDNLPLLLTPTFGVGAAGGAGAYGLGAENAQFLNYWHVHDRNGTPLSGYNFPFVPPYIALGYIMFIGYQ
jgi:hypothetical protein